MVPQDTVLFNDTIDYNIRYGRRDADERRGRARPPRLAQIDGFIARLPDGYETPVGERGLKLSGGEKQRVAIARTILKDPPILILDEATSALDSLTEKEIQAALDRGQPRAARRSSSRTACRRWSMPTRSSCSTRASSSSAAPTHELLARGGVYAAMWNRQREADEARETLKRAEDARSAAPIGCRRGRRASTGASTGATDRRCRSCATAWQLIRLRSGSS